MIAIRFLINALFNKEDLILNTRRYSILYTRNGLRLLYLFRNCFIYNIFHLNANVFAIGSVSSIPQCFGIVSVHTSEGFSSFVLKSCILILPNMSLMQSAILTIPINFLSSLFISLKAVRFDHSLCFLIF